MIIFDSMLTASLEEEQPEDTMQIWMNKLVKMSDPIFRAVEMVPQLPDIAGIEINRNGDAQATRAPVVGQDLVDADVDEDGGDSPPSGPSEPTPSTISTGE